MSALQTATEPHATVTPSPAVFANANYPMPASASAAPQDAADHAPTQSTGQNGLTAQSTTTAPAVSQTYNDKLNAADRYWKFKFALTTGLIITSLIGIGCFGWIISSHPANGYDYYGYASYWSLWPSFVTWLASIIWCAICVVCFLSRKKTVPPGLRVAMELLLWLGFIVTALFAVVAMTEVLDWGQYGDVGYAYSSSSSQGNYVLAENNTWIWEQESSYVDIARDCDTTRHSYYSDTRSFKDCAEQDAYINKLWREKGHRSRVQMTGLVCQFLGLLLHFVLFVWACVDTHHYNRTKISKDAEKLAASIVQTMIQSGAVVPPPGQAYMRLQPGQGVYYQPPQHLQTGHPQQQHMHPMANTHPAYRMPMQQNPAMTPGQFHQTAPVADSGNEKGQPRYA